MKIKSLTLEKYFEFVHPKYIYIQIIPHKSLRNNNSSNIAKAISYTWRTLSQKIKREQKKLFFETDFKISYVIDIYNNNASFYFLVPQVFKGILIEKITEIWNKATIKEVDGIKTFSPDSIAYQVCYKKEDALSIAVDKKSNEPLNSILSVMEIMKETDRITIVYNFLPAPQYGWLEKYEQTMAKIKSNKSILKDKTSAAYIIKNILAYTDMLFEQILGVLNDFLGASNKQKYNLGLLEAVTTVIEKDKELSSNTKKKKESRIIETQVAIVTESLDKTRQDNNALAVCQSYRVLDEDNELIYKRVKDVPKIEDYRFKGIDINSFSTDECQNFIQQPARGLLKQFGINHIQVEEVQVPMLLRKGYLSLGMVKYKDFKQEAFIEDDYDKGSLPLVEVGAQGAGKSTFGANYYRFANRRKEGGVVIDFIKNCELSDEIISYLPQEDTIVLNYDDEKDMQAFAFNECKVNDEMNTFEKLSLYNLQAQLVMQFVDSINEDQPLQARMRKYLNAGANVVFATGETSLKEVINCLENNIVRKNYIDSLDSESKEYLADEVRALEELNEWSKKTKDNPEPEIIGTKMDRVEGILDRLNLLKEDFKLKRMFNKGGNTNIDFTEAIESGKVIIIKMPQSKFKKHHKNIIVTFLLSKIWLATEIRGMYNKRPKKSHIFIDEVFQCKTAMRMLANDEVLPQTRKFGCKFLLSCQYTEQIEVLMDTLEGAGSSFMLMGGTSEKDFERFKSKIEGYEFEDLRDMEKYSSLNLIYYSGGYASFISKLPPPIK